MLLRHCTCASANAPLGASAPPGLVESMSVESIGRGFIMIYEEDNCSNKRRLEGATIGNATAVMSDVSIRDF
jgi:hypothetical protein